jgi:predicted ATPase/class 3 adenylate cyclase
VTLQDLPTGTITFLFTDIEGSTRLWEQAPDEAMHALARHDEIIEGKVADSGGVVVRPRGEGDSRFAVFEHARDAVTAAVKIQQQFFSVSWETPRPLRVRMALHTGEADLRMGDYYGSAVNRCARLRAIAHGGQTLLSAATWELVQDALPPNSEVRDHGQHRLKDLTRPEHVLELIIKGLPHEFPPLNSLTVIPNNLPAQMTEFIGREEEIKETQRLLEQSRLLTVVGPGGIGKSRLSLETAAGLADKFRHGVFFVPLAHISSSEFAVQAVSESIGLSISTNEEPQQQLLNYLRSKQLLLILDNFEHVIDAAGVVNEILKTAQAVKVLATSRTRLSLSGETVFDVPGLRAGDWASPETALHNEAVQLFVITARRTRPDFEVTNGDLDPLRRIVDLVGGSPLGILLAASWVDMLPVGEIADEIAENADFLETDKRDVPERQRSIRAVFDYSWRLLTETEQELFSALSVFRGGFTRQAAQEIARTSLRQLANLAGKSLLAADPETGRYTVHELLRQYGQASLRKDRDRYYAIRTAHARFYAVFLEQAFDRITYDDQREALIDIEADIENVRMAWRYLVAQGDPAEAVRMVRSLWFVHEIRGWHVAGIEIFGEAVRVAGARPKNDSLRLLIATSESVQGWFMTLLGEDDQALTLGERSTGALRELGAAKELGFAHGQMCLALFHTAQMSRMKHICRETLDTSDDLWSRVWAQAWIAYATQMEGNFEEAEKYLALAQNTLGPLQNFWALYWLLVLRYMIAQALDDVAPSIEMLEEVLGHVKNIGWRRGIAVTLNMLGNAAMDSEDYPAALGYFIESMQVVEELSQTRDIVGILLDVASTLTAAGDAELATEMAATAYAHPASAQSTTFSIEAIRDRAETLRSLTESQIGLDAAQAAWERGLAADFDIVVANLIESTPNVNTVSFG